MIEEYIRRPVVVIVGMILLVLFGFMALMTMPYQLTPKVTRPIISISTSWSGATPYEIEREIIERQENVLKGLDGLESMESRSRNGSGRLTLEFSISTPLNQAMLDVSNKLSEVKGYPDDIDRPIIRATGEDVEAVVYMILKTINSDENVREYRTFFNEEIAAYFERIPGVAEVDMPGGEDREMHIILDSQKLAAYDLRISDVINALENANINIAAGTMNYGQKAYRVRSVAEYKTPEAVAETIVWGDGRRRIKISDIAIVRAGFESPSTVTLHNFQTSLGVGIKPTSDANTLELTNAVEEVFHKLNNGILKNNGLYLEWMSDQRDYIVEAINLVQSNILTGAILACLVLFVFLRSLTSTLTIAIAMPLSIFGTFMVMASLGRTLNVISMAGVSFAVGMLVDSAIVVLENIERHKSLGKNSLEAVRDGTKEVLGGLIASVLTTIAIFIPVITIKDEAGQLFRDIAITASAAVCFSLFVSIIVIPTLSYQTLLMLDKIKNKKEKSKTIGKIISDKIISFGNMLVEMIMFFVRLAMKNLFSRLLTIVAFTLFSCILSYLLFPKMEYLPKGNQNLLVARLNPPPGTSYEERLNVGRMIFDYTKDYFEKEGFEGNATIPAISQLYFIGSESTMRFTVRSSDPSRPATLIPLLRESMANIPGMSGSVSQPGVFARGGGGREIDVDISGYNLESIITTAQVLQENIQKFLGEGTQIRATPSLEVLYPEINFYPISERLKAVGLSAKEFGIALDVLMDGRKISEYKEEGRQSIDLILKAHSEILKSPEELYNASIYTPDGGIVPISSLSMQRLEYGTSEIRHFERNRTITLIVSPPEHIPLEQAMEIIQTEVLDSLKAENALGDNQIHLSGNADKLTKIRLALQYGFLLAVLIIYLLMAALYEHFIYPLIILFTVPLAVAGGVLGIWLVNYFLVPQSLDVLTMLGFIILVGIVVNNAILIVYQSLHNVRLYGMAVKEGIIDAVRVRIRPIYMSTLTSLFGMLPLVVAPGAGSEIYRGLGAVILGGLGFSTVITIFVIPCLLSFFLKAKKNQ
ncbi:acriflavin resistance protein [Helicobacter monodelphidis]|uniref:efflux RND transporter permease subunit n=1 Tax=Helicobacter sp. 15-1451 TaxID=2004995 RepID=UPI000DCE5886|nr:efflux RND transporter permease subunit [Helicobacter sp. 15-1451]RAX57172.1 acriflavin resistance protein [Helicobacter sp. 15-1451]